MSSRSDTPTTTTAPDESGGVATTASTSGADAAGLWPAMRRALAPARRVARWSPRASDGVGPWWTRSLRVRLVLWQGALIALVLGVFGLVVYALTANSLQEGNAAAIRAEARIANVDLERSLLRQPPYWPDQLALPVVDTYHDPGVGVLVVDRAGKQHYQSESGPTPNLPLPNAVLESVRAGQVRWYTAAVSGDHVQSEALPIYAPGAQHTPDNIIGVLVTAKTLHDTETALGVLRALLVLAGLGALGGALIGGWIVATGLLHPLLDVAATARTIARSAASGTRIVGLSQRVRQPRGHDELAYLVRAFNTMLTALEGALATQRRFTADASHELRAPLTTIQGNLGLLLNRGEELPPQEQRAMLTDAHAESLRLGLLVNDLLALARADVASDVVSEPATATTTHAPGERPAQLVDLDRIVLDLVRRFRGRRPAEPLAPKLEIAHIEPVRLRGDEDGLRRLALILLDNAMKYTPADKKSGGRGRDAVVSVSLRRQDGQAILRVRDTGIGIDAGDLPHVFEPFYRADRARGRQGTGLGLSIARSLADQHGGAITVESTPGLGSTFTVTLPAPPLL